MPQLSICIPTFRRLKYLLQTLPGLLQCCEGIALEICISDNASDDGTAEYLRFLAATHSHLRYAVQEANVGIDRNMLAVIAMARSPYVLLLGDDDVLLGEAVHDLLACLEEQPDLVVLNGWHTNEALVRVHEHLPDRLKSATFTSPADAFDALWDRMPFGAFLAKRDLFQDDNSEPFIGTSHAYAGAVWMGMGRKVERGLTPLVKCFGRPAVLLRYAEKTWSRNEVTIRLFEIPRWFTVLMTVPALREVAARRRAGYLGQQLHPHTLAGYRVRKLLTAPLLDLLRTEYTAEQIARVERFQELPRSLCRAILKCWKPPAPVGAQVQDQNQFGA